MNIAAILLLRVAYSLSTAVMFINVEGIFVNMENMSKQRQGNMASTMSIGYKIVIVYVCEKSKPPSKRDICKYFKSPSMCKIPIISKNVLLMTYPLLFPCGENG